MRADAAMVDCARWAEMMGEGWRMRAVLLDRDGVLNRNQPDYVLTWDRFHFLPGALWALRALASRGVPVAIVTNQSAINRGLCRARDVETLHERMLESIERAGGGRPWVYYCPHRPDERCPCRKPEPGLLRRACDDLGVEAAAAWLIGDSWSDIAAARACGMPGTLVLSGRGLAEATRGEPCPPVVDASAPWPCALAPNVAVAVQKLLSSPRLYEELPPLLPIGRGR